jgi:hypothetical protein
LKPRFPDRCPKRFSIGNLVFRPTRDSSVDLFSELTYVNYFYFDIAGLIAPLSISEGDAKEPAISIKNISGDLNLVESGVTSEINLEIKTSLPLDLDIGYVQIFLKKYADDYVTVNELINLEVRGLRVGNGGPTSLQISAKTTPDNTGYDF